MKAKIFTCAVVAGCMLGNVAFGQGLKITGKVTALSSTVIELVCDTETWCIKQGSGTATSVISGQLAVGNKVTVKCKSPDAQRKEGPVCFP